MTSSPNTTKSHSFRHQMQIASAEQAIAAMPTLDHDRQQTILARMIAATLHEQPGSHLERFATTGALDAEAVLDELDRVQVPFE